jgi:CRP/FNR family transcriptional regulator, cyclic AMP receptor protein
MNVDKTLATDASGREITSAPAVQRFSSPKTASTLSANHPFFAGLHKGHLEVLASLSMEMTFKPGKYICKQGEPANRFYLILDGLVELETEVDAVNVVPVRRIGPGEDLGWTWLFEPNYFRASARVIAPTKAIFFYATILRQYCEDDHDFGYEMMRRAACTMVKDFTALRQNLVVHHVQVAEAKPDLSAL